MACDSRPDTQCRSAGVSRTRERQHTGFTVEPRRDYDAGMLPDYPVRHAGRPNDLLKALRSVVRANAGCVVSVKRWCCRLALRFGLSALALILAAGAVPAQDTYPPKPLRIIVGFQPGSSSDVAARIVAQQLGTPAPEKFVRRGSWGKRVASFLFRQVHGLMPEAYRPPTSKEITAVAARLLLAGVVVVVDANAARRQSPP